MHVRLPAVAGAFYEGTSARLDQQLDLCFAAGEPASESKRTFVGAVVPHAGLVYSGHVAASLYAALDLPRRFLILCPNHTGQGHYAAIQREGAWRTPFGDAPIDSALATALMSKTKLIAEDDAAHAREHSLEVQLPFLQRLRPDFTFVPLCLGAHRYDVAEEIGAAIAATVAQAKEPVAILASSDLNHYEDQQTTLRKDQLAIDRILALDPRGLWDTVRDADISMCGIIPTTTMLIAAKQLGAGNASLIRHATSGDVSRDYGHVVGYASCVIQ
jgi:MEMO1 family protein